MTDKQREKELSRLSILFEETVRNGKYLDGEIITLAEFAELWLIEYAETQLAPMTVERYRSLLERIVYVLGHVKIAKIQPHHLLSFYNNLAEKGVRNDYKYMLNKSFIDVLSQSKKDIATQTTVKIATIQNLLKGNTTTMTTATKIALALNKPLSTIFTTVDKDKSLAARTVYHHHRAISTVLTTAVQWQLIESNPALRVKPPRFVQSEKTILDDTQVVEMFSLLENEPLKYQVAVYVAVLGGLRLGETVGLMWSDVNFENGFISINKSRQYVKGKGEIEKSPKNATSKRVIQVPKSVVHKLRELREEHQSEGERLLDYWVDSGYIFVKQNGEPMYPSTPAQWFKKWIKTTHLPYITFHQLRHTNASLLISQGVDIVTIAKRLGHARPSTTTDIYGHMLRKTDTEAADKLENLINRNKAAIK
jgi:integrase